MVMVASAARMLVAALMLALPAPLHAASWPAVEATGGMVVSAQRLAAEAGLEMLRKGGNAIDAAVAAGYAEAVTNPCCGNIGGGGFLTAHLADGRSVFINFRETAPAAASAALMTGSAPPGEAESAATTPCRDTSAAPAAVKLVPPMLAASAALSAVRLAEMSARCDAGGAAPAVYPPEPRL